MVTKGKFDVKTWKRTGEFRAYVRAVRRHEAHLADHGCDGESCGLADELYQAVADAATAARKVAGTSAGFPPGVRA